MLAAGELKNFRPLIATPCYGAMLCRNYALSLISLQRVCFERQMPIDFHLRRGDSLVTRARNDCVAYFLSKPQYTHLFFIDADIGFNPDAALRLLRADHPVAAGIYPLKRNYWPTDGTTQGMTEAQFKAHFTRYAVNTGKPGEDVNLVIDADGFMKVREAPTGFMCIKRAVFDRMIEAYPGLKYVPDWPKGTYPEGGVHYRFFDTMVDPDTGRYLSEDYAFCRLWEKLGGEVFADAKSNLSHQGETLYTGDFAESLQSAVHMAVGAPVGMRMRLNGTENLK